MKEALVQLRCLFLCRKVFWPLSSMQRTRTYQSREESAQSAAVTIGEDSSPKAVSGVNLTRSKYAEAIAAAQDAVVKESTSPEAVTPVYIDLTETPGPDATPECIDLTEPTAPRGTHEEFIDLTIESLKGHFKEIFVDLTDDIDELNQAFVDLTIKESKTDEWWMRRKDSLRKLKDTNVYTAASLHLCWPYIRMSKRFKTAPKKGYQNIQLPVHRGKWLRKIAGYPDNALIKMDMHDFPVSPGHLEIILSTLASFTSRVYLIINRGKLCEDRQRAAYDTLMMPTFCEIVHGLWRYTTMNVCRIPRDLFPDQELLDLSLITLHRAKQFFQFIVDQRAEPMNINRLYKDMANIDAMARVVNIFIAELEKIAPRGKKRKSEEGCEERSMRIKTDSGDETKFDPLKVETDTAGGVLIKTEIKDETLEGFPAITEGLTEPKVEVTLQYHTDTLTTANISEKDEKPAIVQPHTDIQTRELQTANISAKDDKPATVQPNTDTQTREIQTSNISAKDDKPATVQPHTDTQTREIQTSNISNKDDKPADENNNKPATVDTGTQTMARKTPSKSANDKKPSKASNKPAQVRSVAAAKSSQKPASLVPTVKVKKEALESLMVSNVRSLSGYE